MLYKYPVGLLLHATHDTLYHATIYWTQNIVVTQKIEIIVVVVCFSVKPNKPSVVIPADVVKGDRVIMKCVTSSLGKISQCFILMFTLMIKNALLNVSIFYLYDFGYILI